MTITEKWRLLEVETPSLAAMNLAIEEAILAEKIKGAVPPTIRFWRNRSAVVLGYSQNVRAEINLDLCRERKIQVVRRFSGGGAVYQDLGNLNYTIAIEADHPLIKGLDIVGTFKVLSSGVIEGLKEFGINLTFDPPSDLIVKGRKVSGNAQSRRRRTVLQHGTLLVNADLNLLSRVLRPPEGKTGKVKVTSRRRAVTNLQDEVGFQVSIRRVKDALRRGFEKAFSVKLIPGSLTQEEERTAEKLYIDKYSKDEWNFQR